MAIRKVAYSRIGELRKKRGLTQAQVAVLVGVTTNTIQNYETGTSGVSLIERILKISELLGCQPEDLIGYQQVEVPDETEFSFSLDEIRALREKLPPLEEESKSPSNSSSKSAAKTRSKESPKTRSKRVTKTSSKGTTKKQTL